MSMFIIWEDRPFMSFISDYWLCMVNCIMVVIFVTQVTQCADVHGLSNRYACVCTFCQSVFLTVAKLVHFQIWLQFINNVTRDTHL